MLKSLVYTRVKSARFMHGWSTQGGSISINFLQNDLQCTFILNTKVFASGHSYLPVHNVEVKVVSPTVQHLLALLAQASQICVQNRRTDLTVTRADAHLVHLTESRPMAAASTKRGTSSAGLGALPDSHPVIEETPKCIQKGLKLHHVAYAYQFWPLT